MANSKDLKHRTQKRIQTLIATASFVVLLCGPAAGQQHPVLVSVNNAGTGSGNALSGGFNRYRMTPDGRYVLFFSQATDILPESGFDLFVRDTLTGTTTLVSQRANPSNPNGISSFGLISDNGRYVAFTSHSFNMVTIPTPNAPNVFLRDLQTATTKLVSINTAGTSSSRFGQSELLDMSPDGRFITFSCSETDLTGEADGNDFFGRDIYVRDMQTNVTQLVSKNMSGTASGNGTSSGGSISADGRYVTFQSAANNLVPNDSGTTPDVFLRDVQAGTTIRLSTNNAGNAGGNDYSRDPLIDRAGRFVVFASRASNLTSLPDLNFLEDVLLYDLQTGTKRFVSINAAGTAAGNGLGGGGYFANPVHFSISADSRYVAFYSQSGNLVTNDTNNNGDDVFRYEVATQAKILVSVNLAGTSGTIGGSSEPSISTDGRYVAFQSVANDLVNVADETGGGTTDVFVRDMVAGQTYLASLNSAGNRTGNGFSFQPVISADGKRIVFHSRASDLITNDLNGFEQDVFTFDVSPSTNPVILQEPFSERAVALDSVIQLRDPFSLFSPVSFGPDQRTRLSLFVWRLGLQTGDGASVLSAHAEDDQGVVHPILVEYAGPAPGLTNVTQVILRLPETVSAPSNLWIKITLRGVTSNQGLIRIKAS